MHTVMAGMLAWLIDSSSSFYESYFFTTTKCLHDFKTKKIWLFGELD